MRTDNENMILIETCEENDVGAWIRNDLKRENQVIAALAQVVLMTIWDKK